MNKKLLKRKYKLINIALLSLFIIFVAISIGIVALISKKSVLSYDKAALDIYNSCADARGENCYRDEFTELTKAQGLLFGEQTLYELWKLDDSTRRCHLLAHEIAKAGMRRDPDKWEDYFGTVNYTTCSTGFMHGVMEARFADDPSLKLDSNYVNKLCFTTEDYYRQHNCVHFMGHLFMLQNAGEVDLALDQCEGINEGLYARCYTGVFMEDSFPIALVDHGIRPNLPDRKSPEFIAKQEEQCFRYTGEKATACWTGMGENYGIHFDDPQKVYDSCQKADSDESKSRCFLKSSGLFAIHPNYDTNEKLISVCAPSAGDDQSFKKCVGWMISSLLYYSHNFTERAVRICENVPNQFTDFCFGQLKRQIDITASSGSKKSIFCEGISAEYKNLCS